MAIGPDPSKPSQSVEFTSQTEVKTVCLNESQARFTHACQTPFLTKPLYSAVGQICLNSVTKYFLKHVSFLPDFDSYAVAPEVHCLLQNFKKPPDHDDQPWPLDFTDFAYGWTRIPSTTSCYSDGWSFAQMKTITSDIRSVSIPATLAWAPFRYGFSSPPWQCAINTMIEKQLNNFNIERLWAIALLDSLFSHNNKMLRCRIMRTAEVSNLVAQEQYESRKFKECIDQMINKVLTTDFWPQMRQCNVICSTNLNFCYDRIVLSVATMRS